MKVRNNARAFILDETGRILLEKFTFHFTGQEKILWVTPGGGVEGDEFFEEALERELFEELGIQVPITDEPVCILDIPFESINGKFISHEVYYMIRLRSDMAFTFENMEDGEKDAFHELKWWSIDELESSNQAFEPEAEIMRILKEEKTGRI